MSKNVVMVEKGAASGTYQWYDALNRTKRALEIRAYDLVVSVFCDREEERYHGAGKLNLVDFIARKSKSFSNRSTTRLFSVPTALTKPITSSDSSSVFKFSLLPNTYN